MNFFSKLFGGAAAPAGFDTSQGLVKGLSEVRLPMSRRPGEGYLATDVDDWLDRAKAEAERLLANAPQDLSTGDPKYWPIQPLRPNTVANELAGAKFNMARVPGTGYSAEAVDAIFDPIVTYLAYLTSLETR